ncbi:MAG: glycosyltransferase family 2 protein, partial [Bdellovibrionaceae bacterium]|nr:glycosyltransferase family 2 protein [Pseudobdellovibrionaceae bacterium]
MVASVIIINWNGLRFLPSLFDSLRAQTFNDNKFEVIFVDNNSSDESVSYIEKNYPEAVLVKHHSNSGFAEGCNIGFKHSRGEYLVLINNDMVLDKDWLKTLVETADKSSFTVGGIVSKVLFKNKPGYINNAGSILRPLSDWPVSDRGFMEKDGPSYSKTEEVSAFCGASVLLKRTMLEQIGIFDQSYFMYFEDA